MPTGLGAAPLGTYLYGYGVVDAAATPGIGVYVDADDGAVKDGRKLDSRSRQYKYDTQGRVQGMDGVYQQVQLAIQTLRDSSALLNFGNAVTKIDVINSRTEQRILDAVNQALESMTKTGQISVNGVSIERIGASGERVRIVFTDLTSGLEQALTL